jgi:CheY-like chemotaxis protein
MELLENSEPNGRNLRFLNVDDNEMNQIILSKMLNRLGYTCDSVYSGWAACDMAAKNRYHIIFMDIMMPVLNGFETARRIKDMSSAGESPVIIGLSAGDFKETSLIAGMDHFISKPFKLRDLKEAIEKFI